jgi:hypothetical protein
MKTELKQRCYGHNMIPGFICRRFETKRALDKETKG